ncbi:hypothetical protein FQN50_009040 [Emmonsiellopsis sp. PD_5]|nr:hypothetical protein FQN50_009040 [Emmonsiellopsis sp. PD_5]
MSSEAHAYREAAAAIDIPAMKSAPTSTPEPDDTITASSGGRALSSHSNSSCARSDPLTALPPLTGNRALFPSPLFPPLPEYGEPGVLACVRWGALRAVSFCLSLAFLGGIVVAAVVSGGVGGVRGGWVRLMNRKRGEGVRRPFWDEERKRKGEREGAARAWEGRGRGRGEMKAQRDNLDAEERNVGYSEAEFEPMEGGRDPLICDIAYYARRVGLDAEMFRVQTEDGFIISLWHLYNPKEYSPLPAAQRDPIGPPESLQGSKPTQTAHQGNRRYPILIIPGLLQSPGAFCANDDDSLAFFLSKLGYDVWLGSNRCGFQPEHISLSPSDPRLWRWTIHDMALYDLPALTNRVLYETGFQKLALLCHSQGTAETFIALSKHECPNLGARISVFCALAPAAYAGPLIDKPYLKFMRLIPPVCFRLIFGIHAFIPFMNAMHAIVPGPLYGDMGYAVFSFMFNWSDARWDRGLRKRFFQFSPVYVSAEAMRWWLGRGGFATNRCILSTAEQVRREEEEDARAYADAADAEKVAQVDEDEGAGHDAAAWYDSRVPPMALWIAGSDELVDGRKLLRRLESAREPHVRVVHSHVIEEYEHVDVLWAMDAIEKVGKEVRNVVWSCVEEDVRRVCRVPVE